MLPEPSKEQQYISERLRAGDNVCVQAVAGAGKTTSILTSVDVPSLLLTYNSRLKFDTRNDVQKHGITSLEVHSYNSFGVAYINEDCKTDSGFLADYSLQEIPQYERIYIDEAQDMTSTYYVLIRKILAVLGDVQLCLLGDASQNIFAFKGSDERYLTLASKIFQSKRPWSLCTLNESYRLTNQMSTFMNRSLQNEKFISHRQGPKVKVLIANPFTLAPIIKSMIRNGTLPQDIFVLGFSTNSPNGPLRKLENQLTGIPRIVLSDDAGYVDESMVSGKLVISSFHRVKGLGRKKTIVINMDTKYYDFDRDSSRDTCPNTLYVALTRSSEELTIVQSNISEKMPWLSYDDCNVIGKAGKPRTSSPYTRANISVRELIKFITPETERTLRGLITITVTTPPQYVVDIPNMVPGASGVESVDNLTGIAIPAYVQYMLNGQMSIYAELLRMGTKLKPIRTYTSPSSLLKLATVYWTLRSKYLYKQEQIVEYNWLSQETLTQVSDYMQGIIGKESVFEVPASRVVGDLTIQGVADIIDHDNIYEVKCTSSLGFENALQLAVYSWLFEKQSCKLVNALTGEIQTITCDADAVVQLLLTVRSLKIDRLSDEEFIKECLMQ